MMTIFVLQRGWVVIGKAERQDFYWKLTNAQIIHRWGTTKGLGEIALNGPTPNTILHPSGEILFHELTTIMMIPCNQQKWNI